MLEKLPKLQNYQLKYHRIIFNYKLPKTCIKSVKSMRLLICLTVRLFKNDFSVI